MACNVATIETTVVVPNVARLRLCLNRFRRAGTPTVFCRGRARPYLSGNFF